MTSKLPSRSGGGERSTPDVLWCRETSSKMGFPTSPSPTTRTFSTLLIALGFLSDFNCHYALLDLRDSVGASDIPFGEDAGQALFWKFHGVPVDDDNCEIHRCAAVDAYFHILSSRRRRRSCCFLMY